MKNCYNKNFFWALAGAFLLALSGCDHTPGYTRELAQLEYQIRINPSKNGTVRAIPSSGTAGTEITIAVNPRPGYRLKESSLYGYDGGAAEKGTSMTAPPYRFNLAKNITIFSEFEPVPEGDHTATVDENIRGGTIIPYAKMYEGANIRVLPPAGRSTGTNPLIVFLVIIPDPGFALKEDSVKWDGIPLSAPFEFILPSNRDVIITAEFEPLDSDAFVRNGVRALQRDDYDSAVRAFDEAYRLNPRNKDAIFYSTLGRLASIAIDVNVRSLMTSVGVEKYPSTLNNLFTGEDSFDNYFDAATGQVLQRPSWLADYSGGIRLWNIAHRPAGYYAIQNQDFIWQDTYSPNNSAQPSMATFYITTFFHLMGTNVRSWNDLVDDTLKYVFGDTFEAAASRAAELDYGDTVVLEQRTIEKLFLDDLLQGGDQAGRAELEVVFASLRAVKAGLEWVSAYDLNMDRSMFRFIDNIPRDGSLGGLIDMINRNYVGSEELIGDFTGNNEVINKVIAYVFRIMDDRFTAYDIHARSVSAMLPLRNTFLLERRGASGMLRKSRDDLAGAIHSLLDVYDYYYPYPPNLPQGIQDELGKYEWAKDCLTKLNTALNTGGPFYFPGNLPESGSAWNYSEGSADAKYGVNMGKLFTPGQLSLDRILVTESGGKKPKMFGWGANTTVPGTYIKKLEDIENYEWIDLQLNLLPIKQVFVQGVEKNGSPLNDTEYVHTVFPDILLTRQNGKKLYEFYYDLYKYTLTAAGR
jgi:hypothetical protein